MGATASINGNENTCSAYMFNSLVGYSTLEGSYEQQLHPCNSTTQTETPLRTALQELGEMRRAGYTAMRQGHYGVMRNCFAKAVQKTTVLLQDVELVINSSEPTQFILYQDEDSWALPASNRALANALKGRAAAQSRLQQPDASLKDYRVALELMQSPDQEGGQQLKASLQTGIAHVLLRQGRAGAEEALELYESSLATSRADLSGDLPPPPAYAIHTPSDPHEALFRDLNNCARALSHLGRHEAAVAKWQEVIAVTEGALASLGHQLSSGKDRGTSNSTSSRQSESETQTETAASIFEQAAGGDNQDSAQDRVAGNAAAAPAASSPGAPAAAGGAAADNRVIGASTAAATAHCNWGQSLLLHQVCVRMKARDREAITPFVVALPCCLPLSLRCLVAFRVFDTFFFFGVAILHSSYF
jgi:tetratricopeptide (TPR) repeat protein